MSFARRITSVLALSALAALPLLGQQSKPDAYLDPTLPLPQRVDDLVHRMTLAEKVAQMQNEAPAIPRLHVAEYDWWNEGLHGVARSGYATVFPQAIGLAATWDAPLIERIADTISTEARAKYNEAQRHDNHAIFYGLTLWSPNINIDRDPRWGRGQETYGEDPFLTGQIGSAFVRGLQGNDPNYFKVIATAKHFAVHSGPESSRHTFDAVVSPHDLEDTYLPAFRSLVVDAHADSVMCAYNSIDGSPACASKLLLQKTLKQNWHFNGYIVSDCAAITDVAVGHKFSPDMAHAAAVSVQTGTDLSCGKEYAALIDAVHQNLITEAEIDQAVKRLFTARFQLGMFDPPAKVAYNAIPFSENDSPAHGALSLEAARKSIVLLKNAANTLPLAGSIHTLAVVGPNAVAIPALEGNYNAVASHPVTPLAALEQRLPGHVLYAQGSPYVEGVPIPVPPTAFSHLKAEFFNGSALTGTPAATRTDRNIDFDWNSAAPMPGVSDTAFSVRWTGDLAAPTPGTFTYAFAFSHCSTCEDAESIHVWLDGKQVYEYIHARKHGRRAPTTPFQLTFTDTKPHPIRIEYTHDAPHFGAGLTFNWQPPVAALREQAVAAAAKSDAIVAFLGLSPEVEGEEMPLKVAGFAGGDRTTIELPAAQQQLVSALAATGKPLVIVLMNGGALALESAAEKASAILEAWYPGQAGGTAIAETLFGQNNPSGRLPVTFYASTAQLPAFDNYAMDQRTYRYFTGAPLCPFGFGLSYTSFAYSAAKLSTKTLAAGQPLSLTAEVKNTGSREGDETVEFYLIPKHIAGAPLRTLVAFERVHLKPGESKPVHATISPRSLSLVATDGIRSIQSGDYDLYVGSGQPSPSTTGLTLPFKIEGTAPIAP
ncbi:glycoside hydrolase family 3 protein [Granulicella sp. WH15]|uniref:glycoside hydrolase family 3 C-terminal domain-containing protein n=1 Tax=Granulicella sp. WH15 TaxID=2602070 RepID=UPI001366ADCE|nr:glycoside hydrolase family 3 C-terminal domain-containing protein [Granulicella sp. WH15]QHN04961.1 glycoside hydrolase family 3 protein [Granulicella sp. WH15]